MESKTATAIDFDDLAVSQHKLGDHRAAIATMKQKDKLMPGIYETYSNLGTFYIYTGELSESLIHIDQALEININAHFGREKYQKWLVLWILETRESKQSTDLLTERNEQLSGALKGFASFVARQEAGGISKASADSLRLTQAQLQAAVRGVIGMMYFADHDNPLLLEALGDLLMVGDMKQNATQLAGLCYLHASLKAAAPDDQKRLHQIFLLSIHTAHNKEENFNDMLSNAIAKGQKLNAGIRVEEMNWIATGKDAGAEFQKKYLKATR